jgi:hypothetical protein
MGAHGFHGKGRLDKTSRTNIMFLDIIHRLVFIYNTVLFNLQNTTFRRLDSTYLRLQVKPTQLDPIDRASPYLQTNVEKHNIYTNLPSSQTFRS